MFIFFDVVFFFFFLCKPVFDTVFFCEKFRIVISKRLMLGAANILGGRGGGRDNLAES